MEIKTVRHIINLILENGKTQKCSKHSLFSQVENLEIKATDHKVNNKFWRFIFDEKKQALTSLYECSFYFLDLTQNIPMEAILFCENGYIDALELYSCDGQLFETVDFDNIEIVPYDNSVQ